MTNEQTGIRNQDNIAVFPNFVPTKVTKRYVHVIENDDIVSTEDMDRLLNLLYEHEDHEFFLFYSLDLTKSRNSLIQKSIEDGTISANTIENFYYRHPNFARDYILIHPNCYNFAWEKALVERGPMYTRVQLSLSQRARRRREMAEMRVEMSSSKPTSAHPNPLILRPAIWGFGIDLPQLWLWLKQRVSMKRRTRV
jgi:hypothetical protein